MRFDRTCFVPVATDADDRIVVPRPRPGIVGRCGRRLRKIFVPRRTREVCHRIQRRLLGEPSNAIHAEAGDVLLLPDSSWTVPMWQVIDRMRDAGAQVGVVQHDFIPLRHPELLPESSFRIFQAWVTATLSRADFVMAVSETVADESREELRRLGRHPVAAKHVTAFRNGSDFTATDESESVRAELRAFLEGALEPPYLTVGTVEPRKNQTLILDALDSVLAAAPRTRLLVAGRLGWHGETVVDRLRSHPGWRRQVAYFADLTDEELRFAYRRARAFVFPSLAEGYGLPIVEAIANGTPVFASDIPVHREVGGDACVFFSPRDPADLARRLIAHATTGEFPATGCLARPLPRWTDAAMHVVQTCLGHALARLRADHQGRSDIAA
jgi:alpha-1,2-rhamnosyltransferase